MVLNYIWVAFFLIALVVGLVRLIFFGDTADLHADRDEHLRHGEDRRSRSRLGSPACSRSGSAS